MNRYSLHTVFTSWSIEAFSTLAREAVYPVSTCTTIKTRIFLTIIDIWKGIFYYFNISVLFKVLILHEYEIKDFSHKRRVITLYHFILYHNLSPFGLCLQNNANDKIMQTALLSIATADPNLRIKSHKGNIRNIEK